MDKRKHITGLAIAIGGTALTQGYLGAMFGGLVSTAIAAIFLAIGLGIVWRSFD